MVGKNHRPTQWVSRLFLGLVLAAGQLAAQVTSARLEGTVRDEQGAVAPGVSITARNVETGTTRTALTDGSGRYVLPDLAVGTYEVKAEMAGFSTEVRKGMQLTVGREAVLDFSLRVGQVTERVEVSEQAPIINVTNANVGGLVDDKKIRDLPLNGRDFLQLALLEAGTANVLNASTQVTTNKGFGARVSFAGARPYQTGFLLDGTDLANTSNFRTPGSAAGVVLGVETIREFQVLVSNFSAEFGNAAGGVINAVTKSGTNEFHGDVFEFLRNSDLDARNFFDGEIPPFKRNQFGGTLGGPLRKDKLFFFGGYEGLRERLGQTLIATVPTAQARLGILPGGRTVTVADSVKPFFSLFPLPNGRDFGNGTGEAIASRSLPTTEDFHLIKIDYNISPKDSLAGRFSHDDAEKQFFPNPIPNFAGTAESGARYTNLEQNHIFSPQLLNSFRFAFNRSILKTFDDALVSIDPATYFVPGGFAFGTFTFGTTSAHFIDNPGVNGSNPNTNVLNLYQYFDTVSYNRGAHFIKTGFNLNRYQYNLKGFTRPGGEYTFNSLQDFLEGRASSLRLADPSGNRVRGVRQSLMGFFVQDDYKVRRNLTLNLGVRYEFITVPTEVNGFLSNLRKLLDPQVTVGDPLFENPSLKNFAPRIGLAWSPFGSGKTSVRAGFGIYDDQITTSYVNQVVDSNPPFFINAVFQNPARATAAFFPNALAVLRSQPSSAVKSAVNSLDFHAHQPYMMQFNLTVERQLAASTSASVGYVGSRGNHLQRIINANPNTPTLQSDGTLLFPSTAPAVNPAFAAIQHRAQDAQSFYNSVQFRLNRRFSRGLQLQASYTFAKVIDDETTSQGPTDYSTIAIALDPFNRKVDRGLASYDQRHAFNFNYTYDLPLGKQLHGIAAGIVKGWQVNGLLAINSGQPFFPIIGFDVANVKALSTGTRPILAPGFNPNPTSGVTQGCAGVSSGQKLGTPDLWFDPCAFLLPRAGTLGNLGRNTMIGPGMTNFDFALTKNNYFGGEKRNVQFRAEFFNLLNRANFANPTNGVIVFDQTAAVNNPPNIVAANPLRLASAGRIRATTTKSRQIQLGLKFVF